MWQVLQKLKCSGVAVVAVMCGLSGCSTFQPPAAAMYPTSTPLSRPSPLAPIGCSLVAQHLKQDGEVIPDSYACPTAMVLPAGATSHCSVVASYLRKDGTLVPSHRRCTTTAFSALPIAAPSAATSEAPCVTGTCGPVSVKGYYRKDGTYVRPHTRSRSK
jgi:hypothetical protein